MILRYVLKDFRPETIDRMISLAHQLGATSIRVCHMDYMGIRKTLDNMPMVYGPNVAILRGMELKVDDSMSSGWFGLETNGEVSNIPAT